MKIARVEFENEVFYAELAGDLLRRLFGSPFEEIRYDGREYPLGEARLVAPVAPSKIVCIAKNYYAHALEMRGSAPEEPLMFLKPGTSVLNPGETILCPPDSERVDYEGELGIVIGRRCRNVQKDAFRDVVLGYTCVNDVTARDLQAKDGQWTRAKGFDTFCPIGPWIETGYDPFNAKLETRLNGEVRQSERTAAMMHAADELIAYITRVMTLLPGDVIATGTPAGIGPMRPGDTVEVELEGIGVLKNTVGRA